MFGDQLLTVPVMTEHLDADEPHNRERDGHESDLDHIPLYLLILTQRHELIGELQVLHRHVHLQCVLLHHVLLGLQHESLSHFGQRVVSLVGEVEPVGATRGEGEGLAVLYQEGRGLTPLVL